ncbi:hypothetical protein DYD21_06145 [Rhodohalobacter sp. SW132]|uniref:hypothetical protein n=1 Tax=Rhodohalobacter sp. SW132 TaxID=2293433 RepID=UPI000E225230|nr:hypothetical protein [Rhodohalobacter sp. SW132]REL38187.1 hypothetical protein DYD21_06145 [Rhodohalobacter sp. SW132]
MASYNVKITRTYCSHHSQNCWAHLQGIGWRKVGNLSVDGTSNVFTALSAARTSNITPNVITNAADNQIELVYV